MICYLIKYFLKHYSIIKLSFNFKYKLNKMFKK